MPRKRPSRASVVLTLLVVVHAGLLAWSSTRHSPSNSEVPALPAGIRHWYEGRFDLFRVNPPLVRSVAALPVLALKPEVDWGKFQDPVGVRSEFEVGHDFVRHNGDRSFRLFTVARLACIPFSILGALVCYGWARDLYGSRAGCLAAALWCFSPSWQKRPGCSCSPCGRRCGSFGPSARRSTRRSSRVAPRLSS